MEVAKLLQSLVNSISNDDQKTKEQILSPRDSFCNSSNQQLVISYIDDLVVPKKQCPFSFTQYYIILILSHQQQNEDLISVAESQGTACVNLASINSIQAHQAMLVIRDHMLSNMDKLWSFASSDQQQAATTTTVVFVLPFCSIVVFPYLLPPFLFLSSLLWRLLLLAWQNQAFKTFFSVALCSMK